MVLTFLSVCSKLFTVCVRRFLKYTISICKTVHLYFKVIISNGYTMGCPPVRGDNPRALASGLSNVQVDNPWYNYFIPTTSV